jgi:hypothetical protein
MVISAQAHLRVGTCQRVNDSLSLGTVNEQLPAGEASGALPGLH